MFSQPFWVRHSWKIHLHSLLHCKNIQNQSNSLFNPSLNTFWEGTIKEKMLRIFSIMRTKTTSRVGENALNLSCVSRLPTKSCHTVKQCLRMLSLPQTNRCHGTLGPIGERSEYTVLIEKLPGLEFFHTILSWLRLLLILTLSIACFTLQTERYDIVLFHVPFLITLATLASTGRSNSNRASWLF